MEMHVAESAPPDQQECVLTGVTTGPFVITQQFVGHQRFVVRTEAIATIARHLGFASPDEVADMQRELRDAKARIAELEPVIEDAYTLHRAIGATLRDGVTVRNGRAGLRYPPGLKMLREGPLADPSLADG